MRNRLVHAYFDINLEILWQTVRQDLPPLIAVLESVMDLCQELGIPVACRRVHSEELRSAQEVFMTTTAGSIMPVRSVDGQAVCDHGGAGEISIRLHNLYWEKRWAGWHATPVRYELAGERA